MFQFPPSPTPNQTFTPVAGVTYRWSGTAWHLIAGPGAFLTAADADLRYVNIDEAQNTTNRIINGKMAIDQRNAGAAPLVGSGTPSSLMYGPDRWLALASGAGQYSIRRALDGPSDFFCGLQVTVADTAIAAPDSYGLLYRVEGVNTADLRFGQATASAFTYAFNLTCSIAGTFSVAFRNEALNRSYVTTVTVTAPSVEQNFVITVPGDTAGTWNIGNGTGLNIAHALAPLLDSVAPTPNTWLAGNYVSLAGQTNLMATVGNQIWFKNVRLYKGSVDFGPDRRLYAEELALCQRYYEKSYQQTIVPGTIGRGGSTQFTQARAASTPMFTPSQSFKVIKRDAPTMTIYNPDIAGNQIHNIETASPFTLTAGFWASDSAFTLSCTTPASGLVGNACAYHWTASAEL